MLSAENAHHKLHVPIYNYISADIGAPHCRPSCVLSLGASRCQPFCVSTGAARCQHCSLVLWDSSASTFLMLQRWLLVVNLPLFSCWGSSWSTFPRFTYGWCLLAFLRFPLGLFIVDLPAFCRWGRRVVSLSAFQLGQLVVNISPLSSGTPLRQPS